MMIKLKVGFTMLVVYEIIAVILLHLPKTCGALFGSAFCADSILKYFIWCVAVPLVILLVCMWIREIIIASRRRSFKYKARAAVANVAATLKNSVADSIDPQTIEKYITSMILAGAKRYADNHPRAKETFDNVVGTVADSAQNYQENSAPVKRTAVKKKMIKKKK